MDKMGPGDSCWDCKHLTSKPHGRPPVFCKAFPKGSGIPFVIMSGEVFHNALLGGEVDSVFFERKDKGA